jgi:phage N-6-adenine-methyltransferase
MKGHAVLMSSGKDDWATPWDFYNRLCKEFHITLDVAANFENQKCGNYFGPDHFSEGRRDALSVDWSRFADSCWMNPPYSKRLQPAFIRKAALERTRGVLTVALLPARTDTKVFHECIYDAASWQPREGVEIRLLPGRLKFGGATSGAPFPSMVVVFRPGVVNA